MPILGDLLANTLAGIAFVGDRLGNIGWIEGLSRQRLVTAQHFGAARTAFAFHARQEARDIDDHGAKDQHRPIHQEKAAVTRENQIVRADVHMEPALRAGRCRSLRLKSGNG